MALGDGTDVTAGAVPTGAGWQADVGGWLGAHAVSCGLIPRVLCTVRWAGVVEGPRGGAGTPVTDGGRSARRMLYVSCGGWLLAGGLVAAAVTSLTRECGVFLGSVRRKVRRAP